MTYTRRRPMNTSNRGNDANRNRRSFSRGGNGGGRGRGPSKIDVSQLIKKADFVATPEVYKPTHMFADFALVEPLKQNIIQKGYTSPTPIQDQTIPVLLEGRDVVGIANTGTGKTAAFLLPLINKVFHDRNQKVLIVAPTRELAVQIEDEFKAFAKGLGMYSVLCIGGVGLYGQIKGLQRNPNFVIGTPGRLKDLEKQRKLFFGSYQSIVLDEVDRMLDMGFINDVKHIVQRLPQVKHSLFFSATMPDSAKVIMQHFLKDPVTISVKKTNTSVNVDQDVIKTNGKQKIDLLHDLLIKDGFDKVLVFGRTKWGMEKLAKMLDERGFKVASIHGNKNQNQRQRALNDFKENKISVLLATDIASRGLDIPDVTHVINYDLPESYEDYVHRIGRTGRANKTGKALTFVD